MTLGESRKTKMMKVKAHIPIDTDMVKLWERIGFIPTSHLGFNSDEYKVVFMGTFEDGGVVIERIIDACQETGKNCKLEISCYYV